MFASDLKIISLASKDVITCKNDNTSPMIRYQKQPNISQKFQNNVTHHNGNRKKLQKIPTNNTCNTNKNINTNSQSFVPNNRKRVSQQQLNINYNFKNNNNNNTVKNQNIYVPTSESNNIVIKNSNNKCSDSPLVSPSVPKNCCDTFVNKNIASDFNKTSSFQKPSAHSSSVSSSSSLSSSSSTTNGSINNKGRVAIRFGSTSTHRKKPQQIEVDTNSKTNKKTLSPVPPMVINSSASHSSSNQQMPAVVTSSGVTNANLVPAAVSVASSSAPVSPNSYTLDFLHSVGVQMTGGTDTSSTGNNHICSSSATVSPSRNVADTQNMGIQGRIIYQDIPPPEKRTTLLNNGQNKYSPNTKVPSPSYSEYPSYDIPILINSPHHSVVCSINTHVPPDNFSSPYNYPPLNNYKRNSYIPVSYPYQKCQTESKNVTHQLENGSGNSNAMNGANTTYIRNRNQIKVWNNGNVNGHVNKNGSNVMLKHISSDSGNPQIIPRVKNHQNIHNLTYVTTDPNNNNRYTEGSRSQSASPKSDNSIQMRNKPNGCEYRPPYTSVTYTPTQVPSVKRNCVASPENGSQTRVASEGYESDSSNSSCGNVKKVAAGRSNPLSSSSSSISSTDVSYAQPSSITSLLNFPTTYAEDDPPLQHFYGSEQNLSHWIPALHAQFMYSAHGHYTFNEAAGELQPMQVSNIKKGQTHRSSFRGGRGRHFIHNNVRSIHFTNDFFFTPPDRFLARSHLVEVKEMPRLLLTGSKWDNLSLGIWNKFVNAQQTEDTFKRKMRLWRYLYIIIKNAYPRYGLYLVGSTISGFGADTSDIDMCLVSRAMSTIDPRMEALFNLTLLRDCLNKTGEFENFNLIEAKVPILRFKDRAHNLEVDLNFNNCVGIKNTHLLYCYSQLDWRLRPLVLVTKLWAQYHNINNAKNMTISSYSLVLMVIHFLQCAVSPPVLPCLHEMYPEKFQFILRSNDFGYVDMNETIGPYESQNTQTIGHLFLQFLQYYSSFNYSQYAISIRTGALIPIEYCRQAKSLKNDIHQWKELCIEEPFDLTNTARSVYDFETFERVKLVFMSSCRVLQETLDINSIFAPIIPTALTYRSAPTKM